MESPNIKIVPSTKNKSTNNKSVDYFLKPATVSINSIIENPMFTPGEHRNEQSDSEDEQPLVQPPHYQHPPTPPQDITPPSSPIQMTPTPPPMVTQRFKSLSRASVQHE